MKTKSLLVLAAALIAIGARADAQDDPVRIEARVVPAVHMSGVWMQVENVSMGEAKDELFSGTEKFAQGASSVTEINLDPNTMSMLGDRRGRDADLARKLNLMVVHSYSYPKPGMYNPSDVDAFRRKLESGNWSCPIHVRNENSSSDICTRTGADHETNEMVILSTNPQKLTFIHIAGKMSLNELDAMSGSAGGFMPHVIVVPHPIPGPHIHVHTDIRRPHEGPDVPQSPETPQASPSPQAPQTPQ